MLAFHGTRVIMPSIIYMSEEGFDFRLSNDKGTVD